jgi:hypothetical protein
MSLLQWVMAGSWHFCNAWKPTVLEFSKESNPYLLLALRGIPCLQPSPWMNLFCPYWPGGKTESCTSRSTVCSSFTILFLPSRAWKKYQGQHWPGCYKHGLRPSLLEGPHRHQVSRDDANYTIPEIRKVLMLELLFRQNTASQRTN